MRYEERQLPHATAWLECGWIAETHDAIPGHRVFPDGCVDIIYDHCHGLRIVGAMTHLQIFDVPAKNWVAAVRLRPGTAGALFRCSALEFTDRSIPLRAMSALQDAGGPVEALGILGSVIPGERTVTPVQRAIHAMAVSNGTATLDYVAREANLSVRQFRRRCAEESGLTPSRLNRILRFRRATRLANDTRHPDWSAIAADAGTSIKRISFTTAASLRATRRWPFFPRQLQPEPVIFDYEDHGGTDCRRGGEKSGVLDRPAGF